MGSPTSRICGCAVQHVLANTPNFTQVLYDPAGRIWLKAFVLPGDQSERWFAVSVESGRIEQYVDLGLELTVQQIVGDLLLGVWRDELDVNYVHLYDLGAGGAPPTKEDQ